MAAKGTPIVKAFWVDAHTNGNGWLDDEEFSNWLEESGLMVTVGFLITKNKKWTVLAMSAGPDCMSECIKIPTPNVKKLVTLGKISSSEIDKLLNIKRRKCR